jgi:hypothetical protein
LTRLPPWQRGACTRRQAFDCLGCDVGGGAYSVLDHKWLAKSQGYPARPVRIIVGWPAGGGADIVARLLGQYIFTAELPFS